MADEVERALEQLRNDAVAVRNSLATEFDRLPLGDPRRVLARHIKAVVSSTYLNWINLAENVADPSWWQSQFGAVPPAAQDEVSDYEVLTTAAFVLYPLSLFEAGLRRIVRALDPAACSEGAAEFKSIYEWLLARLRRDNWSYSRGEASAFLDLYRHVRNTVHNNGRFYSRAGTDVEVTWRGTRYRFEHAEVPAFIGWNFNIALVRELIHLTDELVRAPTISSLPAIE
jgi:hypothetical protein